MQSFIYIYSVGGVIFVAGLVYAARQGYFGWKGAGLRNLVLCLGVLAFFMGTQAYLQFAPMSTAPEQTYQGGAEHVLDRGDSGDGGDTARGAPVDYAIMIGYFVLILIIGTWFGKRQKTTRDFFFGGQRFSWWLISFSMIATTVGSYSFVKYSNKGFGYGLSSSQTYLNDWIWFPILVFGWLPILYFSRITSIPEYFGRRFNGKIRFWATVCILIYLIGYVGVNLFTMGKVLHHLLGWNVFGAALLVALISMTYVTAGGQTSVIMTDLFQGVLLLVTGLLILGLGIHYFGGFDPLWNHLPRSSRTIFHNFNEDPGFPSVGIFWQDGIANTAMFYFLNQGTMMRFTAARSLGESRKAVIATMVILMTVAACVVGGGGWVARALVHAGALPDTIQADEAFYVATEFLSRPGMFGLILAALTAALMSTVDTLITAVAAITVNDIYKPYVKPRATDKQLLKVARVTSISVSLIGLILVPVFMRFDSIYDAHGAFTAAVTPPLVVTFLCSVFWRRFTATAAWWTIVGGLTAMGVSILFPAVISPFAHGVPMVEVGDGLFDGMKQYKFMRACYGLAVCSAIAVVVTWFTKPEPWERQKGLVWGTISDAIRQFKGAPGQESALRRAKATVGNLDHEPARVGAAELPVVRLSNALARSLEAKENDMVFLSDTRPWLGGLKSTHAVVGGIDDQDQDGATPSSTVRMGPETRKLVVSNRRADKPILVEKLY